MTIALSGSQRSFYLWFGRRRQKKGRERKKQKENFIQTPQRAQSRAQLKASPLFSAKFQWNYSNLLESIELSVIKWRTSVVYLFANYVKCVQWAFACAICDCWDRSVSRLETRWSESARGRVCVDAVIDFNLQIGNKRVSSALGKWPSFIACLLCQQDKLRVVPMHFAVNSSFHRKATINADVHVTRNSKRQCYHRYVQLNLYRRRNRRFIFATVSSV